MYLFAEVLPVRFTCGCIEVIRPYDVYSSTSKAKIHPASAAEQ